MSTLNGGLQHIIAEDVPQLEEYLSRMKSEGQNIDEYVERILREVDNGNLETENGISLLDIKYHYLLDYIINMVILVRMKLAGSKTGDCRARWRLIEDRVVLERTVPVEHKIKYQVEKMLQQSTSDDNDPLSLKPNIDNLDAKEEDVLSESEQDAPTTGKYIPPRIAAMHYEFEEDDNERRMKLAKERALKKSSVIRELVQEASDSPLELSQLSSGRKKVIKDREERTKYEENNLMRLNLTKRQKNLEKQSMRRSELDTITKFGDIGALEGNLNQQKANKRKAGSKYKSGKKWKRFKK